MSGIPDLPFPPGTRIIGDLHLDVDADGEDVGAFVDWLGDCRDAPRIVILGDLFEYWIGPAQERSSGGTRVLEALRAAVEAGTEIDLIPGNRDFLVGSSFEERSGARVRPGGLVGLAADERRILVLHGDELCTLDSSYQRLRSFLRSRPVRWLGPRIPGPVAGALARRLRRASRRAVSNKPAPEVAIQASAAAEFGARHDAELVVCGHAHSFRTEQVAPEIRLLVIDAFGGSRDVLRMGGDGYMEPEASGTA